MERLDKSEFSPFVSEVIEELEDYIENNEIEFTSRNALTFYALDLFNHPFVQKYIDKSEKDIFWNDQIKNELLDYIVDNQYGLWALAKLGILNSNLKDFLIDEIESNQTKHGKLNTSSEHGRILRCLVLLGGDINVIEDGIDYLLKNSDDIRKADSLYFVDQLSGFISLAEYDYYSFENEIGEKKEELVDRQNVDGSYFSVSEIDLGDYEISFEHKFLSISEKNRVAIEFLSRIIGLDHEGIKKSIDYLQTQYENFEKERSQSHFHYGALTELLLSLCYAGKGVKKSTFHMNWERKLDRQKIRHIKPIFLHTSPTYKGGTSVREINQMLKELIDTSIKSIKILSPYIDIYYEDLIDKINEFEDLEFKIITRPKKDISGERKKTGKQALEQLNRVSEGNLKTNKYLHSRMIIADEEHLLVGSADLTRDQLYDQFNAGIYTRDDEAIKKAAAYFENIWGKSEHLND